MADPNANIDNETYLQKANRLEVEAKASFPVALDPQTKQPSTLQDVELVKAIIEGKVTFNPDARIPVIAPDGQPGSIPALNAPAAFSNGFKMDNPSSIAARRMTKEHPTWSAVQAGLHQGSEAFLGIPEAIAGKIVPGLDESTVAPKIQEEAAKQHPTVSALSRVASEGVVAVGTMGLGKVGGLAKAAEGAVLGERVAEAGKTLAEATKAAVKTEAAGRWPYNIKELSAGFEALDKAGLKALADEAKPTTLRAIAGTATRYGVESALMSTPKAAQHLFEGDPEKAAETIVWGAGLGTIMGAVGGTVSAVANSKLVTAGEQYAAERLHRIIDDPGGAMASIAGYVAEKGTRIAATAGGHASHFVPGAGAVGYFVSRNMAKEAGEAARLAVAKWAETEGSTVAKKWLQDLAYAPIERGFGSGLASSATSVMGQKLAKVPGVLGSMGANEIVELRERKRLSHAEIGAIAGAATKLASSPEGLIDAASNFVTPMVHDQASSEVATMIQGKLVNTVNYIAQNSPKPNRLPTPFAKDMWQPNTLQLAELGRRLEVVYDPFIVLSHLAKGTLTKEHVETLSALYPKTYEDIRKAIIESSTHPNLPQLSTAQRQKLGLLMGSDVDPLSTPAAIRTLQLSFMPPPQAGGPPPGAGKQQKRGPGRPPKVTYDKFPSTFTASQNVEHGRRK